MTKIDKSSIIVEGARENNLRNINIKIPKDKLVVFTGVSGSGKSSLAFDTIYADGYRRYMENLSSFARFFLQTVKKPKVTKIENLSPTIAIDQKTSNQNPRSTVGTLSGVYDFIRHLFANLGIPYCPKCGQEMKKQELEEIVKKIKSLEDNTQIAVLGEWREDEKNLKEKIASIENAGFARIRVGGRIITLKEFVLNNYKIGDLMVDETSPSRVEVVVDRMTLDVSRFDQERLVDSLLTAVKVSNGQATILIDNIQELAFNKYYSCPECGYVIKKITAKNFSFNSPLGACDKCSGLGKIVQVDISRVIPNKKLSLLEGAIMPWSRNGGRSGSEKQEQLILEALAKKYKFSLKAPIEKISQTNIDRILFGIDEPLSIGGIKAGKIIKFNGVVKSLEEKYQKADTTSSRTEMEKYLSLSVCPVCSGRRLKKQFLAVKFFAKSIDELSSMEISDLDIFFQKVLEEISAEKNKYPVEQVKVAQKLIHEIIVRLKPLCQVGLEYLDLDRSCQTLSGGEFQRTRLATQLYSGLSGVVYILDEPSIGLHSKDSMRLIKTLREIKDKGNSVIVVEHDKDIIMAADYLIDMGPGAGQEGGKVIFQGSVKKLLGAKSQTSLFVSGKKKLTPRKGSSAIKSKLTIIGASENNLKNINVTIPLGKLVTVCGVSGSGKSSLINDILAKQLRKSIMGSLDQPGKHKNIEGYKELSKVIIVDQSPIGRSPRSNAATYTGIFSHIRDLFAKTEMAKDLHLNPSHFSFNMRGGRCEYCQGEGVKKIEMHLLDDVFSVCRYCNGTRYSKKILNVQFHGENIADVLDMSVDYAKEFFSSYVAVYDKLSALSEVGLGYLRLGQSATELSGGEAQRIKLAAELGRKTNGSSMYILDEPTIGLHYSDIEKLLKVLQGLVDKGNSVIVVEHNTDIIKISDWVIELGPEGGKNGGRLIFEGLPQDLSKTSSWTGKALSGKL